MTIDALLERPAGEGARVRALELLDAALAARVRLDDSDDEEVVHDFRVALRRLRSLLKVYAAVAGKKAKKLRRELGDVAEITGDARDAEVQLEWLVNRKANARHLMTVLRAQKAAGYARIREEAGPRFDALEPRVRRQMSRYRADLGAPARTFAAETALLVQARARSFAEQLSAVGSAEDEVTAHEARIAGKELRYLVEPLAGSEAVGQRAERIVKTAKGLQDLLGELHDVHVLSHRVARMAIAGLVRARRDELYGELVAARPTVEQLVKEIDDLASRLGESVEIERKYLLKGMPPVEGAEAVDMEQGYLPGDRLVERLRRSRTAGGVKHIRSMKLGAGIKRIEVEEECPPELWKKLWPLTEGKRVKKRRFKVKEGDLTWEIDRFEGRELVLAEIELPSEDTQVQVPAWLAPFIDKEVTGDKAFTNEALAC